MSQQASPDEMILGTLREKNPIVLLLGQDAWRLENEQDAVLSLALERLGRLAEIQRGWPALLGANSLPENFYEWLSERFSRRPTPNWLTSIARLPWSAVFTSSLDSKLAEIFASGNREPQAILTASELPVAARSTTRTPIYYLFSRAGVADIAAMPPRSRSELRVRSTLQAIPMLNRLAETATAVGLVVLDGISLERDWLALDPILAVVDQMPGCRVLWCGWKGDASNTTDEVSEAVRQGRLITTPLRLGSIVAELDSRDKLGDVVAPLPAESGTISFIGNQSFSPSPGMRIRVEAVTSIVDDSWSAFLPPLGSEAEYVAFRHFHGDVEGPRGLVNGVRYGFAIVRDFETRLKQLAKAAVEEHSRFPEPIVAHGQSGTGKSIALARLVAEVREDARAAVLYSVARIPQSADIDEFCESAEQRGALVTLVVCDCNAPVNRYRDLLTGLRSRGRRVVLAGSSYRQVDSSERLPRTFVDAPDVLSEAERDQLARLLAQFGNTTSVVKIGHDRNVLATLYRALPSSRHRLAVGLSGEARATEEVIRERGKDGQRVAPRSALAEQLIAVGLATENERVLDHSIDDALKAADDSAGRLIDFVMAAGRLNCPVPINLLMRAVAATGADVDLSVIARMFQGLDLFRWRRSDTGAEELLVSPRLTLEAELICRRRLINATGEGAQLVNLMKSARLSWDAGGTERRFLLDLVQRLGPDGPLRNRYRETYLEAARALTELRRNYGVNDPSLMLQEAVLRRSAIREEAIEENGKLVVLEEAREAVQTAMDQLAQQSGRGARRARANLSVERAAIYGFLATDRAKRPVSSEEVWSAYQAARAAARAAVAMSDAYFPLDVSLWIPADLIESGKLSQQHQLELFADIHSVLDRIDPESFPTEQRERFNRRLYTLGERLNLPHLSDEAFAALEAEGSTGGYYLRARSLGPEIGPDAPDEVDAEGRQRAEKAAKFLKSNWSKISQDERCLRYLLQCEWIAVLGRRLLRGERAPLPSDQAHLRELLRLVKALNAAIDNVGDNNLAYLEAVLSWMNNEEQHAQQIWRELARDTDFIDPRRVIRRHVVTDENLLPVQFSGRIESESEPGRFTVRVANLNRRIQLLARDFPGVELAYGRTVSAFAIAFNYIGPIADSPHRR